MRRLAALSLLLCTSCGGPSDPFGLTPIAPPTFAPCPAGWRAVDAGSAVVCSPWEAPSQCPPGQAHFPGAAGCEIVGDPCPSGEFAEDLPADATEILYVSATASSGGDGSREAPFATIPAALDRAAFAGTIVAVGKGSFEGPLEVPGGVTVWGACAEQTRVSAEFPLVVLASGRGAAIRNLHLSGPVPGIWVQTTSIDARGVIIDGASEDGVMVRDGGHAQLTDVVVRNTLSTASSRPNGIGMDVLEASTATLSRVVFEGNHSAGVFVSGAGAALDATDLAVLGTLPAPDGGVGNAMIVFDGARATLQSAILDGSHGTALSIEMGSSASLADVVVSRTSAQESTGTFGRGINVQDGSSLEAVRVSVESSTEAGVVVLSSSLDATSLVVRTTSPRPSDGTRGTGLVVAGAGAIATISAAVIEDNVDVGILVDAGGSLSANDIAILSTRSGPSGTGGRGLGVQNGAGAVLMRARILDNREAGVLLVGAGASLTDVAIARTREAECAQTGCSLALGDAVALVSGSRIMLTRFALIESARSGILIGDGSEADLFDGEIAHNPIGASIQASAFDPARLQNDVELHDNDRNLDRGVLPLPEPSAGF